ncbi:hypothetical protein LSCM1_01885 [Leishmania martiniquensis]|uniref:EamA domain-containing protein n=1 Tax=Leishmania martiniquensis TaxID=1580590 RepID=A0A836GC24_9TRYP|nr:hypothetical protein LSCM1_01885 [Leishmania martiniquensis]
MDVSTQRIFGDTMPVTSPSRNPRPLARASVPSRVAGTHRAVPTFFVNASIAGVCGALSGVVGKLAVESARVPLLVEWGGRYLQLDRAAMEMVQAVAPWLLRILCFLMNVFLTASMWRFYLKALSQGPTPVCQILNTGTNFVVSALAGLVLFAEEVTPMWGAGALLIVLGLALVVSDPQVSV